MYDIKSFMEECKYSCPSLKLLAFKGSAEFEHRLC